MDLMKNVKKLCAITALAAMLCFGLPAGALAACLNPGGTEGEIIYNTTHDVFQGCTAAGTWIAFHDETSGGSVACSDPSADPGAIIYNSTHDVLQGCTANGGWMALHGATGDAGAVTVSRIQYDVSDADRPAIASFSSPPTPGNLLVVVAGHRRDSGGASISGSGWTQHMMFDAYSGDTENRRGLAIWSKVAGASEPTDIEVVFGSDAANAIIVAQEFAIDNASYDFDTKAETWGTTNVETSVSTGTTGEVSSGLSLVVTGLVIRYDPDAAPVWTNGISSAIGGSGPGTSGGSDLHVYSGFNFEQTYGTKESTASWTSSDDTKSSAGIVVFALTPTP